MMQGSGCVDARLSWPVHFITQILADIKNLTAKGEGTMPGGNEKYRVMWEGIPSRKTDREF
ncbi:hypothetical protein DS62_09080 [Smithella sp. SC_K08D17]|jgi:hypothetical protein|nr:hypothetical protein DS62_09080 [Smithella sp. SC_K08D17]